MNPGFKLSRHQYFKEIFFALSHRKFSVWRNKKKVVSIAFGALIYAVHIATRFGTEDISHISYRKCCRYCSFGHSINNNIKFFAVFLNNIRFFENL